MGEGYIFLGLFFGLVFIVFGFVFKVLVVLFYMWMLDVYEGVLILIMVFFVIVFKMVVMGFFVCVVYDVFGGVVGDW